MEFRCEQWKQPKGLFGFYRGVVLPSSVEITVVVYYIIRAPYFSKGSTWMSQEVRINGQDQWLIACL